MILTHIIFFNFLTGASEVGAGPAPSTRVVNAPFLVNVGTMLNR